MIILLSRGNRHELKRQMSANEGVAPCYYYSKYIAQHPENFSFYVKDEHYHRAL